MTTPSISENNTPPPQTNEPSNTSTPPRCIFPLTILKRSKGQSIEVELRGGESLIGILLKVDPWMNMVLHSVKRISPDGRTFWALKETCLRGSSVAWIRFPRDLTEILRSCLEDREREDTSGRG